jgi:DNA modification methylase
MAARRLLSRVKALIATDKTGRVCRGVELDPLYVDVIVRRYEAASGQEAMPH